MNVFHPDKRFLKKMGLAAAAALFLLPGFCRADQNRNLFLEKIDAARQRALTWEEIGVTPGKVKTFRFGYGVSETFSDNIHLTYKSKRSDWITTPFTSMSYTPLQNERTFVNVSTRNNVSIYAKDSSMTNWDPNLRTDIDLLKDRRFRVRIRDAAQYITDTGQTGASYNSSQNSNKSQRITNSFGTNLEYDLSPKTFLSLGYGQNLTIYTTGINNSDSVSQTITPSMNYRYSPKLTFSTSYVLSMYNYLGNGGANSNSTSHGVRLGVQGILTPKSSLAFNGGYMYKIYENRSNQNGGNIVFSGHYHYALTPKTQLGLFATHTMDESVNSSSSSSSSGYVKNTALGFGLNSRLTEKISAQLSSSFGFTSQPSGGGGNTSKNGTSIWRIDAGITCQLKRWLSLAFSYSYTQAFSDIKINQYTNNRATISLQGSY